MKRFFSILGFYIRQHAAAAAAVPVSVGIFILVFSLYSLPIEAAVYGSVLAAGFLLFLGAFSFAKFYRRHCALDRLKAGLFFQNPVFSEPGGLIEKDYQEIIRIMDRQMSDVISEKDAAYSDMMDYYTIWVHQIKTPIAAIRLLLQSEPSGNGADLLDQLFRIEQYVDMVLQYLRLENMNEDLLIRKCSLDSIVKQAVRKYAKSFIRKKIRLDYRELDREVLTDEKWLVFVVEQILSNALKYTREGTVSIRMDPGNPFTLLVEDTGIGIAPEDLPRLFSRGFTGCNGREDKKSTGIGLYLCRRILNKLSHTISIDSEIGKGTRVSIGLDTLESGHE